MEIHNLPQYSTPLVGREVEIVEIGNLLQNPNCRMLTLVGPGGIGKTRLAIAAASVQAQNFKDGVFFVALQPIASADKVVHTVGSAVNYEFSPGSEPALQLQQHLREKDILLILDNLEHLPDAAGIITDLLAATSQLSLLITSRGSLNLQDEWLYHVRGLRYPEVEWPDGIERYDAVRLYAEHARRVRRDFSLDEEQDAVVRICRLVQGMPLGIELAAKWQRRLPSAEIAQELQNSLDILQTDLQDVHDRHRSMRAVFDHSWKLLSEDERGVFMALSVFRGGFLREAADEVAGATLAVLMGLVDKSMLRVSRNGRYEIHELQRQYAAERLEELPELKSAVRDRHGVYYTRILDRPVRDFLGPDNVENLKAMDAEIDNIRLAWEWALSYKQTNCLRRGLMGLHWYAWSRSWHKEAVTAFDEAVRVLRTAEPTPENQIALGRAIYTRAAIDVWSGRALQAAERTQESLQILRPLDAQREIAEALQVQGWAALEQQDWQNAKIWLEEATALFVDSSQYEIKAFVLGQLGHIARVGGDYDRGEYWYREALSLGKQIGDQRTIAESLIHLGNLAQWQGQYFRARELYREGLEIAKAARFATISIGALHNLGAVSKITGEFDAAHGFIEESLRIAKEDGKGPGIAWSRIYLADLLIAQGEFAAAREQYQQALRIPPGMADRGRYALVRAGNGRIAWQEGEYAKARRHHEVSLSLFQEMRDRAGIIDNLAALARIALAQDDKVRAAELLTSALQSALEEGSPPLLLHVFAGIAELFFEQGKLRTAFRLAALVTRHPASSAEARGAATKTRNAPQASRLTVEPAAAVDRDKNVDLSKLGKQLVEQLSSQPEHGSIESLSKRELEVLYLVAEGSSNNDIARELILTVGTVKTHLHNILQKLDASSRTQAVARARELHLL